MINLIGRTVQHYQILLKIRETPTRILYKVADKRAHAYAALEVVKNTRIDAAELLGLINEQAQRNAKLSHPNIAAVTDSGIYNGLAYLVYDFSPTHPFRRFFNRTFTWEEMSRELVSIAHALAHAHENGIVHGYLNPAGILLDEKQNPVLFDFGFEQIITDYLLAHSPGTWVNRWGSEYRAPEQWKGAAPDARSDIYAFGTLIHEWLTGRTTLPDPSEAPAQKTRKRGKKGDSRALPPVLLSFLQKCTAADPSRRYQSMQEIFVLLAHGALNMSITGQMVKMPLAPPVQHGRRGWAFLLLTVGLILIAAGGYFLNRSGILFGPTAAPQGTAVSATATRPVPTATVVLPTSTATVIPVPQETLLPNLVSLPVFQGTPIASLTGETLSPENAYKMVMIGQWGMGDLSRLVASPDGQRVAAASSMGIFIFQAQDLAFEKYIDTGSSITALAFSPDGKMLASGGQDGLIQTWDTSTWEEARLPFSGHTQAITDLAFSPDGVHLVSVARDNLMIQWPLHSDEEKQSQKIPPQGVNCIEYSADSSRILTGGNDFKINVWDSGTLALLDTRTFDSQIVDIAGVKNSSLFVLAGADGDVELLDPSNGFIEEDLGFLQYPLTSVAASPAGDLFVAGDIQGGITAWKRNADVVWRVPSNINADANALALPGSPHSLSFSPDGKTLFSGLHKGLIRSLEAATGKNLAENQSFAAHVEKLSISGSLYALTEDDSQNVTLWDIPAGRPLYYTHGDIKDGVPISQNGRMVAVASGRSTVKVFELNGLKEMYTLNGHLDVRTIEFIQNGAILAAGYDKDMHLWSTSSGQELVVKPSYPGQGCTDVADLNDQPILSVTEYQRIVLLGVNNPGMCAFKKDQWTADIDEKNGLIAYGGSSKLAVIYTRNGSGQIVDMTGVNRKNVVRVAISPDGKLLAAAFDDNVIRLWDIAGKVEIMSLYGHKNLITDLRFTVDGKLLFSTSRDGVIRIWGIPK